MLKLIRSYFVLIITAILCVIAFVFNLGPLWVVEVLGFMIMGAWVLGIIGAIVFSFYATRAALTAVTKLINH